jgi:uncharacterized protein (DUF302 family)
MKYGYTKQINLNFDETIEKVREELPKEGFGILTEIDVKETLKKKLDVDFTEYVILGACNPSFAYKALQSEIEIGLLLPCNVIVYKKDSKVFVSGILPTVAMSMVESSELSEISEEVEDKMKRVINNL